MKSVRFPGVLRWLGVHLIVVVGFFIAPVAIGHEFWIDRHGNEFILQQGHRSAAHPGATSVAYPAEIVKAADCFNPAGRIRPLAIRHFPVRVDADCALVQIRIDSGYWSKTPYDTVNQARHTVKNVLRSWKAEETVSRIEQWSAALLKRERAGLLLDLASDPAALKTGDKLVIVASLDGMPIAGVPVAYDGETRGATDATGRINLRLRHGGLQQITASIETPLTDGQADTLIRAATLNFVLP